ncbi:MAG: serine/threonine-protein kinase [Blastocatellia bacterium]
MNNENDQDISDATTSAEPGAPQAPDHYLGLLLKDRYLIERELGRGGIGVVYLARDRQLLSREVVVKVLFASRGNDKYDSWFTKKFRQEMEALSRINHPGVVGVLDSGEAPDGKAFLVMQYIRGVTLRQMMPEQGMDFDKAARIIRQAGQALEAAHEKGVFHRDLKPENIMIEEIGGGEFQIKLIDFGVARIKDSQVATSAEVTWIAGTPPYMAPEQLRGRPTAESDIYGLAAVAYEMLTGRPPFKADSAVDLYELQKQGEITKPKEIRRNLPGAAENAILRALSFNASDRYASALQFAQELARSLTGQPLSSSAGDQYSTRVKQGVTTASAEARLTTPETATRFSGGSQSLWRRFKLWLPLAAGAALLIAAGALIWNSGDRGKILAPEPAPMTERLSYWMMVQKYRDGRPYQEPFKLTSEINFENDYHVRMHVTNRQPGFLYILNEGPEPAHGLPSYVLLFPSPTANQGSAQLTANQQIAIPERGDGFFFDREQGMEKLWLVWSASRAPEMESVKEVANPKDRGAITDPARIRAVRDWLAKIGQPAQLAVEKDEQNKQTNIKGRGETLVHQIRLEHH